MDKSIQPEKPKQSDSWRGSDRKRGRHRNTDVDKTLKSESSFFASHDHICDYTLELLADSYNCNPLYGGADFRRDVQTIRRRSHCEGISFLTKTLPSFFDSVLIYLETGVSSYPSFRIKRGSTYPAFLQRLVEPIYSEPNSECAVICMNQLYQVCVAFKKLEGPYSKAVLAKQLSEFVATDAELLNLNYGSEPLRGIVRYARGIIRTILKGLDPTDPEQSESFLPRPGPGATNDPTKNHVRFHPHVVYSSLEEVFDLKEWYFIPSRSHCHSSEKVIISTQSENGEETNTSELLGSDITSVYDSLPRREQPTSRFKFVPKTYSKARGICIEQLETQWLQQGIKNALYERIEAHPITKGRVLFTDQSVNGGLALKHSFDRRMATIDMSSASDRVSRKLVNYLFYDNAPLRKCIMALSTKTIELPRGLSKKQFLESAKYAPMGSALCFPIMALVHYALIRAIIVFTSLPHRLRYSLNVYVYGDDIIVPSECAQAIYDWLPMFGMKLNTEKSFVRSSFRESCGMHAYYGKEITPTRFKTVIQQNSPNTSLISALRIESALYYKGFYETARLLRSEIHKVKRFRAYQFPFVSPKSQILGWIREDCDAPRFRHHLAGKQRWNQDHQCFEYKVRCIRPRLEVVPPLSERDGYLRKMVTRVNTKDAKRVSGACEELVISHRWLPASAF